MIAKLLLLASLIVRPGTGITDAPVAPDTQGTPDSTTHEPAHHDSMQNSPVLQDAPLLEMGDNPQVRIQEAARTVASTHAQGSRSWDYWTNVANGEQPLADESPDMAETAQSIADRYPEGSAKHAHWSRIAEQHRQAVEQTHNGPNASNVGGANQNAS